MGHDHAAAFSTTSFPFPRPSLANVGKALLVNVALCRPHLPPPLYLSTYIFRSLRADPRSKVLTLIGNGIELGENLN